MIGSRPKAPAGVPIGSWALPSLDEARPRRIRLARTKRAIGVVLALLDRLRA